MITAVVFGVLMFGFGVVTGFGCCLYVSRAMEAERTALSEVPPVRVLEFRR